MLTEDGKSYPQILRSTFVRLMPIGLNLSRTSVTQPISLHMQGMHKSTVHMRKQTL
jgi:hypothetical protein